MPLAGLGQGGEVPPERSFPIIGIGASAGGLAAFEGFFGALRNEPMCDMAFILVQHLAPDHPSILTELLRRFTSLPVFEVTDGMTVRRNCVYVIPPNKDLAFLNGTLQLLEMVAPRGQRMAIDFFFRSLAQDQHDRAVGIVLSGTGSDGTLGVRAVKGEGGLAMAQTPETTEFDGMPRSAIATGLVDFVLAPAQMPGELNAYCQRAFGRAPEAPEAPGADFGGALRKVFVLMRAQTGHDFSQYKQSTLARRVARRLAVHRIDSVEDYVRFLQQNPGELDTLFHDLLIGVTSFFRDPEAFAALEASVVPHLFADKAADSAVRVWVPGCSTGEEAYSIAILLMEYLEATKRSARLQIFATDIDSRAIAAARTGLYPASIVADVSAERLSGFFTLEPDGSHYRVQRRVRDLLVFSEHNVIRDPPFSKLDLISCRNLLIYMGRELQEKLMPLFDYALRPGGYLFLGVSETIGDFGALFKVIDRQAKLYQDRDDGHTRLGTVGRFFPPMAGPAERRHGGTKAVPGSADHLRELTERSLLQHRSLAAALVDGQGKVLYLHGRTGQYLELASGPLESNIVKMARAGLKRPLSVALRRAGAGESTEYRAGVSVRTNGDAVRINLTVQPVGSAESPMFLVILEDAPQGNDGSDVGADAADGAHPNDPADGGIEALRRELMIKEESLRISNEELETSNEELKSSNEEMQSVNEELQSTNEEMETSKEELQSVNEELSTVNFELQSRVADLSQANNDMNNLLAGTGVGTIFVGHRLEIKRFTPSITPLINLIPTDIGRSVGHLASNLIGYDSLVEDVQKVLDTLVPIEVEVQSKGGQWFLLRIRPYRTLENLIEGAVITFTDVSDMKQAQADLVESRAQARLAVVVRDAYHAITVQGLGGRIMAWNPGATRMYGWSESEALTMNIRDMIPETERDDALHMIRKVFQDHVLEPYRTHRLTKDGQTVAVSLTATALVNDAGEVYAVATTERPIT